MEITKEYLLKQKAKTERERDQFFNSYLIYSGRVQQIDEQLQELEQNGKEGKAR